MSKKNKNNYMSCVAKIQRDSVRMIPVVTVLLLLVAHVAVPTPVSAIKPSDVSFWGNAQTKAVGMYDYQWRFQAASLSSVRLNAAFDISNKIHLDAAFFLAPNVFPESFGLHELGIAGGRGGPNERGNYRAFDLPEQLTSFTDGNIAEELRIVVNQNLDRLFASVYLPFGDLYIGRQAISWGSARAINPTSVFSSSGQGGMQTEELRGVDALRLRIPYGMMGEIDTGYVFGKDLSFAESAAFARVRTYIKQTDLTFLLMDVQEHLLVGLDAASSIGGAGAWIEAAYILPDAFDVDGGSLDCSRQEAAVTIGMDYTFSPKFYGFAEYHFNSAGKKIPEEYLELITPSNEHPTYRDGLIQLSGRHYMALGGTYQLHPLLPVNFFALINAGDPSAVLSLEFEYSLTQDVTFNMGSLMSLGEYPDRDEEGTPFLLHSEFGMNPQVVYLSADIYF